MDPRYQQRTWVTRRGVLVDRIASAWLIQRFVDPAARFRFVETGAQAADGEVRFDMADAEFTHQGDRCTFETLARHFQPQDRALAQIGEIVHDLDLRDGKFGRPEAAGVLSLVQGLAQLEVDDLARIAGGGPLFDCLYASFHGPPPTPPKGVLP